MTRARNVAKTFSGQNISGNLNLSGIVTATSFSGEGSGITGITAVGSGVTVLDGGVNKGAASKLDFTDGISVSNISSGIATVAAATTSSVKTSDLNVSGMATIGGNASISGISTASSFSVVGLTTIAEGGIDIVGFITAKHVKSPTGTFDDLIANDAFDANGPFSVNNQPASFTQGITVTGVTTSTSAIIGSGVTINNGGINLTGVITATSFRGDGTQLTGVGTASVNSNTIIISGVSTFTGLVDANGGMSVAGVSTFANIIDANAGLDIAGVSTFSGNIDANADLDVDGHTELDNVNVAGFSTFASKVDVNAQVDISTDIRVGGAATVVGSTNLDGSLGCTDTASLTNVSVAAALTCSQGINVTGIVSAATHVDSGIATYYGDSSYSAAGRWVLGADGSNHYTFTGPGLGHSTLNDPELYLKRGQTYMFENKMGAHPFRIQSTTNGSAGTQWNVGVTNNDVSNGVLIFEVPFATPNTLYYQCTAHANMGGVINIA